MNRVRGLNASAGFMLPGSMLDSIFVVDSFVGAAGSRRGNNNNNRRLSSPPTATTTRDIGGVNHRPHVPPPSFNVLNGTMADDFVIVFDTYVGRNNALLHTTPFPPHPINVTTKLDNDSEATCSICLCELSNDSSAVQISCSHVFHRDCIEKWITVKRTCPLCRIIVS
ncbi:E3 ubiquitin-protein ligase RZF1-like [Trifolium pratense]|uniref:E3 ubiquitin-protein ligase RZF1-like n=1 Tax=Trifolium pratense TaxID=57577 RepID=UPI001E691299|nr:E3 ubiquitin-protein ligase RZF1-like [Trifolium pratense]